jgi:hypothetical protein
MPTSLHDRSIVGYETDAPLRRLTLCTGSHPNAPATPIVRVLFIDVEAYSLVHDAFGNIISSIDEVPATDILQENRALFEAGFRQAGWPRFWRGSFEEARKYLLEHRTRGFELCASIGMSGWVLSKEMAIEG